MALAARFFSEAFCPANSHSQRYWKYDWTWSLQPSTLSSAYISAASSSGIRTISSTSVLAASSASYVYACTASESGCSYNATGTGESGCGNGWMGVECSTCKLEHFYRGGSCIACSDQTSLASQVIYLVGLVVGIVLVLLAAWFFLLRPAQAVIALKLDGDLEESPENDGIIVPDVRDGEADADGEDGRGVSKGSNSEGEGEGEGRRGSAAVVSQERDFKGVSRLPPQARPSLSRNSSLVKTVSLGAVAPAPAADLKVESARSSFVDHASPQAQDRAGGRGAPGNFKAVKVSVLPSAAEASGHGDEGGGEAPLSPAAGSTRSLGPTQSTASLRRTTSIALYPRTEVDDGRVRTLGERKDDMEVRSLPLASSIPFWPRMCSSLNSGLAPLPVARPASPSLPWQDILLQLESATFEERLAIMTGLQYNSKQLDSLYSSLVRASTGIGDVP